MEMRDLSSFIEAVKSSTDLGRPLSPLLGEAISKRERTVCIAEVLVQNLWNGKGLSGWIAPSVLKDMVRYIWHHAPDFFVDDDSRRIINEDTAQWNQEYLDLQRNYLRHNFSLRRLCHLVMVYEYLHGDEAKKRREEPRRPIPEPVVRPSSPVNPQRSGLSVWRVMTIIAPVILLLGATVYLLERHNSGARETSTATECDRLRAGVGEAAPPHKHPENDVQLNKELPERILKSLAAKDASHQMAQATNTSLHLQGQMNQQMPQGTNSTSRLSEQGRPQMSQGTSANVMLAEQEKPVERATVGRLKGSGSR